MNVSSALERPTDAYDAMAPWYDAYTDHPHFRHWIGGLEELAREHGVRGRRLLDAGCGTGKSLAPLLERGYDAVGVDGSSGMLAHARERLGDRARLVQADLTALPELGTFDLVTCLNDVVNCVHDPDDVARVLAGLGERLAPGGVLVFDTTLLGGYRAIFGTTHRRERDGSVFTWVGEASPQMPAGEIASAWLDVFLAEDDGRWRRLGCRHVQRHHPHAEIAAALDAAGLELVALLGDADGTRDGTAPDDARHLKAIHVARRRDDRAG